MNDDLKRALEEKFNLSLLDEFTLYGAWRVLQRKVVPMLGRQFGNWQTTALGFGIALLMQLQLGIPTDKAGWIGTLQHALVAALGLAAKDAGTGSKPGATN